MAPAGGPVDDSDCILKVYTCFTPFKRFIVSTGNMLVIQCAPAVFQCCRAAEHIATTRQSLLTPPAASWPPAHKAPGQRRGVRQRSSSSCRMRRSGLPSGVLERHNRRDVLQWRVLYRRHSDGYRRARNGRPGASRSASAADSGWTLFAHREIAGKFCIYPRTLFSPAAGVIGSSHPSGLLQPARARKARPGTAERSP